MARGVSFELVGLHGLLATLDRVDAEVRARVARVNQDAAHAIQARARANVPTQHGDLARAIAVDGKGLTWRVGLLDLDIASRGGTSSHRNPSVYGRFIEYGTVKYTARPFMRPAVDAEQVHYEARLAEAARDITATLSRVA